MRLGLIGFPDEARLGNLLKSRNGLCRWERGPYLEADALWVNGQHAQTVRGSFVKVASHDPRQPATVLNLKEVERPTAFSLPVADPSVHAPQVFDLRSAPSIDSVFRLFEARLQPLAAELALAQCIADRRFSLNSPVYHLSLEGNLVGIVNLDGNVGLHPGLTPELAAQADWSGRPLSAGQIPQHFSSSPISHVMWQHIVRSDEDMLPSRYRGAVIYFRAPPTVPQRMLRDVHMLMMAQLHSAPQTLAQLRERTGLGDREVSQALAALYFAGGITTHPDRTAWPTRARSASREAAASGPPSSMLDGADTDPSDPDASDMTVPASLEMVRTTRRD